MFLLGTRLSHYFNTYFTRARASHQTFYKENLKFSSLQYNQKNTLEKDHENEEPETLINVILYKRNAIWSTSMMRLRNNAISIQ